MELYKIRYNLYNYIFKDNIDFINTKEYIILWKYFIILIFIILCLIFIYKIKHIYLFGYIIIFIMILFIYIIYFELSITINEIENNIYLKNYGNYYELSNIFFNEAYDFIPDSDIFNPVNKRIKNLNELTSNVTLNSNEPYYKDSLYLFIDITNDNENKINEFIRKNFLLYNLNISNDNLRINLIFNNINSKYNLDINNLFSANTIENNYLIYKKNDKYYIQDGYLYINIDKYSEEYFYFLNILKTYNYIYSQLDNSLILTITNYEKKIDTLINYIPETIIEINDNGSITKVNLINNGSEFIGTPEIIINDKNGSNAILKATMRDNKIISINVENGGKDYTSEAKIIFKGTNIYDIKSIKQISNSIYLKLPIINITQEINNQLFTNIFNKLINVIENDKDNYKKIYRRKTINTRFYLQIKLSEITEDNLKTNIYISKYIYQLIDIINKNNIDPNIFITYANTTNDALLFNYLTEYNSIKSKIINNMKYEDNKIKEEITDSHYYFTKKNNDLLKYIDIYNLKYINKYCFVEETNILKDFKINTYNIDNKNYYILNIANLNNPIAIKYINEKYETNFKNFNILYQKPYLKSELKIKQIIDDFNYEYNKFIIIFIILLTIICHIFYIELIR